MENASKALMIAGAVLITLLVLGIAMYFFTQFREFPKEQEAAIEREQIAKFNQEYESYNKQKMYGVDVVTILNKAISNNKSYANFINGKYLKDENNYYIDVQVTLLTPVSSSAVQYKEIPDSNGKVDTIPIENKTIRGKIEGKGKEETFTLGEVLPAKTSINLLEETSDQVFMNEDIQALLKDFETVKIKLSGTEKYDEFNYTLVSSGFTNFKRKYFECTGIEYNKETSRVSKLIFKEIPHKEEE